LPLSAPIVSDAPVPVPVWSNLNLKPLVPNEPVYSFAIHTPFLN